MAPRSTATPWWERCSPSSRSVALRDHEREAERTQGARDLDVAGQAVASKCGGHGQADGASPDNQDFNG